MSDDFNWNDTFSYDEGTLDDEGIAGGWVKGSGVTLPSWDTNGAGSVLSQSVDNAVYCSAWRTVDTFLRLELPWLVTLQLYAFPQSLDTGTINLRFSLDAVPSNAGGTNPAIHFLMERDASGDADITVTVRGGTTHTTTMSLPGNSVKTLALQHLGSGSYRVVLDGNTAFNFDDSLIYKVNGSYLGVQAKGASETETPDPAWQLGLVEIAGHQEDIAVEAVYLASEEPCNQADWWFTDDVTLTGNVPQLIQEGPEGNAMAPVSCTQVSAQIIKATYPDYCANRPWRIIARPVNISEAARIKVEQRGDINWP